MNIWEARYKALAAGISDKALVDNAEKITKIAMDIAITSGSSLSQTICGLLHVTNCLREKSINTIKLKTRDES